MNRTFTISVLCLAFFLISCDKYQSNLNHMSESTKKQLSDFAFKENIKISIIDFKPISYDTINENTIDTIRLMDAVDRTEWYTKMSSDIADLLDSERDQYNRYLRLGWTDLASSQKKDYDKHKEEGLAYLDSAKIFTEKAYQIRKKIEVRTSPKPVYKFNAFIKASMKKGEEENNLLDTIHRYFDEDLNLITPL